MRQNSCFQGKKNTEEELHAYSGPRGGSHSGGKGIFSPLVALPLAPCSLASFMLSTRI